MIDKIFDFDNSYEKLPPVFYKKVDLTPKADPGWVYLNEDLASSLGLDPGVLRDYGLPIFAGSVFPEDASQIAMAYAGHQFGHLTMLGDGRALLVGEVLDPNGARFDIHLKGSGRTPYSRGGDGKATLGFMLKEYIFSESIHYLGVPSSRSLALVRTGEGVVRNGVEKGAVLTRVAQSHLRIGTFEYAFHLDNIDYLRALASYAIKRHYPHLEDEANKYLEFFDQVMRVQAQTLGQWMALGFIHGVMNTDNVTISGETIDYGPCAFMDTYDPDTVFSSIDRGGRYRYGYQAQIMSWNMARFGEALLHIIDKDTNIGLGLLNENLKKFKSYYDKAYYGLMASKLGIFEPKDSDWPLVDGLLAYLHREKLDYSQAFVDLTRHDLDKEAYQDEGFQDWKKDWQDRLSRQAQGQDEVTRLMEGSNPVIIPRNYWVEEAIKQAEDGDFGLMNDFLQALKNPYDHRSPWKNFMEVPEKRTYVTYCGT